ncbi:MAG: helix-turn-helix domain-containing protein [Cytophagales bacterium]|nr:helix-turn-helix domain-containing protein [Cytophagales bacterium]
MDGLFDQFANSLRPIIQEEVCKAIFSHSESSCAPKGTLLFYNRKEVAKILKISLVTLDKYIRKDKIIAHRLGRKVLFKPEEVENCLEKINTIIR